MDTEETSGGILERLRNSPRTVSAVIVILIIAGAIFAFSGREDEQEAVLDSELDKELEEMITEQEDAEVDTEEKITEVDEQDIDEEPEAEVVDDVEIEMPQAEETADAFVEVAQPGEGMTHLARRAATAFLESNPPDFEVTNEHRVFIEDYIVKKAGSKSLAIGEQVTVSKDLAQEAISMSRELTDAQLQNLERFSQRIDWS